MEGFVTAFKELVAKDAVMICGAIDARGTEYAEYINDFSISEYEIKNEEVIYFSDEAVQIH